MKWNKLTTRNIAEEEKEFFHDGIEYVWEGKTPEIDEEVLVYNPKTQNIYTDIWIDYGEGIGFENTDEDSVFWMSYPKPPDDEFESIGDGVAFLRETKKIDLMLSTNAKDKTGKEIFEGDVLQIDYVKAIVRFGQYRYYDTAGKDVLTDNGFYLECLNVIAPDCISPYETDILDKAKIIGNIYEKPEYDQNFVGFRIEGE